MYAFDYKNPSSLSEATDMLRSSEDGQLIAGGHTLLPTLKQRLASVSDLIDLASVSELKGISVGDGSVTIGAMTTHAEVAASSDVRNSIPALADLADGIGDPQVRNRGTIGGSIANNDPAADYPAALVGLGATVNTDSRSIPADDFFTGMFETALVENEIVTSLRFRHLIVLPTASFRIQLHAMQLSACLYRRVREVSEWLLLALERVYSESARWSLLWLSHLNLQVLQMFRYRTKG